jgi:hypothetical protein
VHLSLKVADAQQSLGTFERFLATLRPLVYHQRLVVKLKSFAELPLLFKYIALSLENKGAVDRLWVFLVKDMQSLIKILQRFFILLRAVVSIPDEQESISVVNRLLIALILLMYLLCLVKEIQRLFIFSLVEISQTDTVQRICVLHRLLPPDPFLYDQRLLIVPQRLVQFIKFVVNVTNVAQSNRSGH